jgi:redox-sensitive bicupin YhaK (pirin superfamily)
MPAVTVPDVLVLPRISPPDVTAVNRPVTTVVTSLSTFEGEGFPVRRPFPGRMSLREADPFLLLDHMGAVEYAPGEPKGTSWHPHRGFETVTYIIDGAFEHQDSTGGGGLIADGATQWMTAGSGLLHIEKPPEALVMSGGLFHGVQLWVNLPASLKMTAPRYQDIGAAQVTLATTPDGGAIIRVIAGELGGISGPGITWTPIAYAHATVQPGAEVTLPWNPAFTAMVYALSGRGSAGAVGAGQAAFGEGQLVNFGDGDAFTFRADARQDEKSPALEVLILGGQPIREQIAHYGPFVMNSKEEVMTAMEDFNAGRMGQIPATARR